MVKKDIKISFRAPITLRELVRKYIGLGLHMNESEFYRQATIEKIRRDAPSLYRELFEEATLANE